MSLCLTDNMPRGRAMGLLLLLCLMVAGIFFALGGQRAEAASKTLNYFQYESYVHEGRDWVRIELGIKGGTLEYSTETNDALNRQLRIKMQDVARGPIKSDIDLDKKIAKYLNLREDGEGNLTALVTVTRSFKDQAYKIYTAEPDRKGKKPYRLVIEIAADKTQAEYDAENPQPKDSFENLAGHHIVIDPGHGGSDSGAHGPNGLLEKNATLAISQQVANILRNSGAVVNMTRTTDVDVYGPLASDRNELQARVNVTNRDPFNEIFVSIHCDAFTSPSAHGSSTFYYAPSYRGQLLAEAVHQAVIDETGLTSRGAKTARFYVLRNSAIPATLVETAFISNYNEERLLGDEDFQYRMALAICRGISQYFRMR